MSKLTKRDRFKEDLQSAYLKDKEFVAKAKAILDEGLAAEIVIPVKDGTPITVPNHAIRLKTFFGIWNDILGFKKIVLEKKQLDEAEETIRRVQEQAAPGYRKDLNGGDRPEYPLAN